MKTPHLDSETALKLEAIELFKQLHWQTMNCFDEKVGSNSTLGRKSRKEVVLTPQLRQALIKLNPELPEIAIQSAIEEITQPRHTLSLENSNREIYKLLKKGVKVTYSKGQGAKDKGQR